MSMKRVLPSLIAVFVAVSVAFAAASYPTSVKVFTTKTTGETIAAAHVNDLQDEVVAIEQGLLNGFAHALKPSTDAGQTLGTSALRWKQALLGLGTVTVDTPALDITGTWNAVAVAFTGIKANFTDTASAAASLLLDLQVGGVSKFKVDKAGVFIGDFITKGTRPWIDVRGRGAVGDGVTDDTTAIQDSLNALPATGGIVFFPAGTYKVTAALTITDKNGVTLLGAAPGASTISVVHIGNALVLSGTTEILRPRIQGLTFAGDAATSPAIGISMTNAKDAVIEHIVFGNFKDDSIRIAGANSLHIAVSHSRISAHAARLATAHAVNASAGTTVVLEGNYFAGYAVLLDSDVDGLVSMGNIYESSTDAIETAGSNFLSLGDWFSVFTRAYVVQANNATTIIQPRGVTLSQIDHTGVTVKRHLTVIEESQGLTHVGNVSIVTGGVLTVPVGVVGMPPITFAGDEDTGFFQNGADTPALVGGGVIQAYASEPTDGNTAWVVRRNVGGTFTLQRVSMGAVDSGGAGFKLLRVSN